MSVAEMETATDAETPIATGEAMCLSPSIAKILIARSPLHAWTAHRLGGNEKGEPSEAMDRGRILDRLLFGVGPEIVPVEAPDWRSKAAQALRDEAEADGKLPVLAHKLAGYGAMVEAWGYQFGQLGVTLRGESQVTLRWLDVDTPCKGIVDHLIVEDGRAIVYDLKTCDDASDEACGRAFTRFGYDVQHAAYVEGVERTYPHLAGRVEMRFLFCETARPHAVNVVEPAGTMKALGRYKWRRACSVWAECLRTGAFPGYATRVTRLEARPWELDAAMPEGAICDADL